VSESHYRALYRIRRVEEEIARVYPTDKIMSPVHLSIGQEAVSVAVCAALRPDDVVFGSYRCHALYLAKGGDLKAMIAELFGKATGCAKGKGGSMHLIDVGAGMMGASAVVGTTIPLAIGYAMALKMQGRSQVVTCFFGDGAAEEGVFHEGLNFAALKRLPILFVCENNFYAIHARQAARQPESDICGLVRGHGIPAEQIPDLAFDVILERARRALTDIRSGSGPHFLECLCYRWMEHVGPNQDYSAGYRTLEEASPWLANDQVKALAKRLDATVRAAIEAQVEQEVREAFAFAEGSPFPEEADLLSDLLEGA
jgi:TPP-dependent pyruvate/acetoin dehydrogenase alpha subunit